MKGKYIGVWVLMLLLFLAGGAFAEGVGHVLKEDRSAALSGGTGSADLKQPRMLPATYDLRDDGIISSVKNPGVYDTGWAFAALDSLESTYRKKSKTAVHLSVKHLAWYAYKDKVGFHMKDPSNPYMSGGNYRMATATMARWTGAVLDSLIPYDSASMFPSGPASQYPNRLHLTDAYFLTADEVNFPASSINLKQIIYSEGPIASNFFAGNMNVAYNGTTYAWKNGGEVL